MVSFGEVVQDPAAGSVVADTTNPADSHSIRKPVNVDPEPADPPTVTTGATVATDPPDKPATDNDGAAGTAYPATVTRVYGEASACEASPFVATSISQVDPFDNPDTANDDAAPDTHCSVLDAHVDPFHHAHAPAPERRRIAHADCTPASASGVHNTVNPADRSAVVAVGAVIVGAPGPCDPDTNADNNQPNRPAVVATACAVAADAMSCDPAHHALGIASTYPAVASRTANAPPGAGAVESLSNTPVRTTTPDRPACTAGTNGYATPVPCTIDTSDHTKPRPPRRCSITTRAPHTGPAGCHTGRTCSTPDTCRANNPTTPYHPWRWENPTEPVVRRIHRTPNDVHPAGAGSGSPSALWPK